MKHVALDLHDFTPVFNRLDLLLKLKEHFYDFRLSVFAIPVDTKMDYGPYCNRAESLKEIKKHLDWIQLIPHGYIHNGREVWNMSSSDFKKLIKKGREAFEKDGLPHEKGFCAPHWKWSDGVIDALDEMGWWGAVMREDVKTPKRFYRYTHLINEPFMDSDLPVLKLHGHQWGTKNDIGKCIDNLLALPKDTKWHFVTDYLETS